VSEAAPTVTWARAGGALIIPPGHVPTPVARYSRNMPPAATRSRLLRDLQHAHRACHRCVDAGFIERAHPVFSGTDRQHILLVGQAPGPVEVDQTRPFAGRAGRELMRWLQRAGFRDEDDARRRIYMTAMTTCFPGKRVGGSGDRRPSAHEVALCAPWLDSLLALLQPRLILPIGSLALGRFMPASRLDDVVGSAFTAVGARVTGLPRAEPILLPLPHPSGQSRWLNDPGRRVLLERALSALKRLSAWADSDSML
jgi:uracil-DNA glycosylase family 4